MIKYITSLINLLRKEGLVDTLRRTKQILKRYGSMIRMKRINPASLFQEKSTVMSNLVKELVDANHQLNEAECQKLPLVLKSKPILIYAELSTKCNLRCKMCGLSFYNIPASEQGLMGREIFEKISQLFVPGSTLALFGRGESLLHPDFIYFLNLATRHAMRVTFNTNGLLLNKTMAKAIVENRQHTLIFSCSAGSARIYKKIHGSNSWEKFWDNIDMLNEAKLKYGKIKHKDKLIFQEPSILIEFVSQLSNITEFPNLVWKAFKHNISGVIAVDMVAHSKEMEKERMNLPETIPIAKKYYDEAKGLYNKLIKPKMPQFVLRLPDSYSGITKKVINRKEKQRLNKIMSQLNKDNRVFNKQYFCLEPWQTFYVRFDGTVTPCCITNRVMGHLNQNTAKEIWNGTMFKKFRKRMLSADKPFECLKCHLMPSQTCYDKALDDLSKYDSL